MGKCHFHFWFHLVFGSLVYPVVSCCWCCIDLTCCNHVVERYAPCVGLKIYSVLCIYVTRTKHKPYKKLSLVMLVPLGSFGPSLPWQFLFLSSHSLLAVERNNRFRSLLLFLTSYRASLRTTNTRKSISAKVYLRASSIPPSLYM